MKTALFIFAFLFCSISFAGEITGVGKQALRALQNNRITAAMLKQQGLKVLDGEVTGAGSRINLDRIQMLVTNKELFKMNKLSHIEYLNPSEAKALKDVSHLEFDTKTLNPNQIKAIIYE